MSMRVRVPSAVAVTSMVPRDVKIAFSPEYVTPLIEPMIGVSTSFVMVADLDFGGGPQADVDRPREVGEVVIDDADRAARENLDADDVGGRA
jgi:hypothetical protein